MKKGPKITRGNFYLKQNKLVKVININQKGNRVIIFRYDSFEKEHIEWDTAPLLLIPLYTIGEVARSLQRAPATIRKYETRELIPKAKQFKVTPGGNKIRLYSEKDILELADFFAGQRAPGRPSKTQNSKIDRKHLTEMINSKYREWRL